jgi:hypothetical protein
MFFVGRRYFRSGAAAAGAALLLAMTPVHFFYSRVGVEVVYILPFVLVWLLLLIGDQRPMPDRQVWPVGAAGFVLGVTVYAYKTALIIAPAYLCASIVLVALCARTSGVPARRVWALTAASLGGFVLAVAPYGLDALRHADRISQFSHAYGVGSANLSPLQNLHDFLRYQSIGDRLGTYFASFNPAHLFFFGAGGWTDSTRQAGLFLAGVAVPIAAGLYAALGPSRSFPRLLVAAGFLLAPASNFVVNEVTLRRMIPIAVFGVLLAIEGWRFIWTRWRLGRGVAAGLAVVTLVHFVSYYRDYQVAYPLNSYKAWELNLGEALQRLAARAEERGLEAPPLILVRNQYVDDYARLYLPQSDVIQRARRRRPSTGRPVTDDDAQLVLRQVLIGEDVGSVCPSWRVVDVIREPAGDPSFVICER